MVHRRNEDQFFTQLMPLLLLLFIYSKSYSNILQHNSHYMYSQTQLNNGKESNLKFSIASLLTLNLSCSLVD